MNCAAAFFTRGRAARRSGVEDEHVDAPVERAGVVHDVGRDRFGRLQRQRLGLLDRQVHLGERRDVLLDAVLVDVEVLPLQARDELSLPIENRGIDLDVVDLDLEGDAGLVRRGTAGGRLPGRGGGDAGKDDGGYES
jgi:hypothetical protein